MSAPDIEEHLLADNGPIPNNPRLPLLLYRGALHPPKDDPAAAFEQIFARWNWKGSWRNGIYTFSSLPFHEPRGVGHLRGSGDGAARRRGRWRHHRRSAGRGRGGDPCRGGALQRGQQRGFGVVGAYPDGHTWDLLRGLPGERPQADENIAHLPLPSNDPVHGARTDRCGNDGKPPVSSPARRACGWRLTRPWVRPRADGRSV